MTIDSYLKKTAACIEEKLDSLVIEKNKSFDSLFKAARYSLLGGGKRLRPILTMATAETFGGNGNTALLAGCALELIHTYSLIHDDLPCMDNDDFRRGKPSLHKAFGEGHAVLAGDYLLTYAFEILANESDLTDQKKIALISLMAKNSGCRGMIAGQVMDIEATGRPIPIEDLKEIHRYKTGALINASVLAGGIIADVQPNDFQALHAFSSDIGLAFQIVDDILDVTSSEVKHGKTVASDSINGKITYATLLGIPDAQKSVDELYKSSLSHLAEIKRDTSLLQSLAANLVYRKK